MRPAVVWRIAGKELGLVFSSPIAYLFLAAFLGATLFVFFWGEAFFARNISDVRPMFESLPILLIFLASALTMRMWSDERRTGTLELVVTVPANAVEFVVGKFLACWTLLLVALVLTLPLPVTVAMLGDLDWGPVVAGYVAAALLGAAYLSIGLWLSARTENQIVALILAVFGCGVFYLAGSPFLTELVSNQVADVLRGVGAGSRFESITRGVLDLRDLYFYASVMAVFLALNVYAVDAHGWAADGNKRRHGERRLVLGLLAANVLVANLWLSSVGFLRWDMTEGNQYSISEATRSYLRQLQEPLLLRGYFSAKTHPLLAPLVPQIQNLLTEYEVAGDGRVRLELLDPADDPEREDEANTKYGIRPVPFQVADRYQASLVNSYFDVLVQYGDEYEVLGFRDLIEVKVRGEADLDVQLKNPEYDITRGIKKVLYGFQGGGSVFESMTESVKFTGYISADDRLPEALRSLRPELEAALDGLAAESAGLLTWEIVDPDAGDGEVARQIAADYGFRPMAASLFDLSTFYFYLTASDGDIVVQMPLPEALDQDGLRRGIEEGLKRFATGLLKNVALSAPQGIPPYMQQQMPGMQQPQGNEFQGLRDVLSADFDVDTATLDDGDPPSAADVLMVVDPTSLSEKAVFAIDQFLMRGGTVVVAAGSYRATLTPQALSAMPIRSGLAEWLLHHGVTVDESLVKDPQNAAFPLPVTREVAGFRFQDVRMLDYPYFVDVRGDGLNQDVPFTSASRQLTMAWVSPVDVDTEANTNRTVTTLLQSSTGSWRSASTDIMPTLGAEGGVAYLPEGEQQANTLGVMLEGRFESFFDESPFLEDALPVEDLMGEDGDEADETLSVDEAAEEEEDPDTLGTVTAVIDRSPESARLIVLGSASFVADQTVRMVGSADGTIYTGSLELMANIVDWAVEDQSLLGIRGRGHFNRTLDPMSEEQQRVWEYVNYALALAGLAVVFVISWRRRIGKERAYAAHLRDSS
ncbi:MAG: Gldg family protein [Gammaproteobacteria bacterium]|nr:Gldg family protein [Gammaproteobacteria bacterium]